MIDTSRPDYDELNDAYKKAFGAGIPLYMVPTSETNEGLAAKIEESISKGQNLLGKYYHWDEDVIY